MGAKHPTMIDTIPLPLTPDPGPFWLARPTGACHLAPDATVSLRYLAARVDLGTVQTHVQVQVHDGKVV